jgi:hypothetical protein
MFWLLLLILQTANPGGSQGLPEGLGTIGSLGVGGAIAVLVIWINKSERERAEQRFKEYYDQLQAHSQANEKRWQELAGDFKTVIQENTRAATSLVESNRTVSHAMESVATVIVHCPGYGNARKIAGGTDG